MAERIFSMVNLLALLGWVLLVAFPRLRWVRERLCAWALPAIFAGLYAALIAARWSQSEGGGFSSLAQVAALFADPWLLLAGWLHYLAFDMVVGSWIARDAHDRGLRHLWVVPSLVLTFLFGPAGWLSYMVLRFVLPGTKGPAA